MNAFLIGKKVKMDQIWKDEKATPVTVIKAAPNTVSAIRMSSKHGYEAVQLSMPIGKKKILKEFRIKEGEGSDYKFKTGDILDVSLFNAGDKIKISATSKGKGFQGVVKRHGFSGGPKSHGQKDRHRAPGSIGAGGVQKVIKGLRMGGHMGLKRVSVKNISVIEVDKENNTISINGAVPGFRNSIVEIRKI